MTPARFREILRTLCWSTPNLAGRIEEARQWHDALEPIPPNMDRWLQILARVKLIARMVTGSPSVYVLVANTLGELRAMLPPV